MLDNSQKLHHTVKIFFFLTQYIRCDANVMHSKIVFIFSLYRLTGLILILSRTLSHEFYMPDPQTDNYKIKHIFSIIDE